MDVGRDLIDHRIVDLDGHDVGRVDDLWVCVPDGQAFVGPIVSGAGALFRQFGGLGHRLQRIAPHLGYHHATRWREFGWNDVEALERPQIVVAPRLADIVGRPEGHVLGAGFELLYTKLIRLPVYDPTGRATGVVDVRTTLPTPEPKILGLLVAPHPLRHTLGMKRFDSTSERFAGTRRDSRYLPWRDVAAIDSDAIRTRLPLDDLPMLSNAADSQPPPVPQHADAP